MTRKCHVRFLGGSMVVISSGYPTRKILILKALGPPAPTRVEQKRGSGKNGVT